ncbi:small subunit rRNA processing protein, putative [Hepatocystis sp. ex Piliocolobus tephrosceles]|nr:small subunit rRNA processing protein, putative [Hepatocystis sp. ex Piliocolobus tephrosceles]
MKTYTKPCKKKNHKTSCGSDEHSELSENENPKTDYLINEKKKKKKYTYEDLPTVEDERFQFNDSLWKHVQKEESRKGIVYLSHVPMGLNVSKIREIFSKYGMVDKIYLNKKKEKEMNILFNEDNDKEKKKIIKYEDGYVEFAYKEDAIKIVQLLNNQIIEEEKKKKKKRTLLNNNFWHLKFLNNFTWNNLVSPIIHRNMSRKVKFNYALKNMYKRYETYLEKHEKGQEGDKTKKQNTSNKVISKHVTSNNNKINKPSSSAINTNSSNKLHYVTTKKKKEVVTKKIKKEKKNVVSTDLLKLF